MSHHHYPRAVGRWALAATLHYTGLLRLYRFFKRRVWEGERGLRFWRPSRWPSRSSRPRSAAKGLALRPERELLTADKPEAFAAAVLYLFNDRALADRLGRAGRDVVRATYGWEHRAQPRGGPPGAPRSRRQTMCGIAGLSCGSPERSLIILPPAITFSSLAEEGARADLLRTTATAVAIPPDDHRALKAYTEPLYTEHLRTRLSGTDTCFLPSAPAAPYSRTYLTQQLANVLTSLSTTASLVTSNTAPC